MERKDLFRWSRVVCTDLYSVTPHPYPHYTDTPFARENKGVSHWDGQVYLLGCIVCYPVRVQTGAGKGIVFSAKQKRHHRTNAHTKLGGNRVANVHAR
jgi:hypothetical protein